MPLAALLGLLLLPGLTIVHAGWVYVPFLSISYWIVSWGWLSPAGPGRDSFLLASFFFSGALAALRLFKPLNARTPGLATVAVAGAAFGRLLPWIWWPAAPGLSAGFSAASSLLLVWHGSIPRSLRPLYPLEGFGQDGFGLPALGADISLLSGTPAHHAQLLASLAAEGLVALAAFTILKRQLPATLAAAAAALAGAVVAALAGPLGVSASSLLALALGLAGGGLAGQATGWPTAAAAGAFLGASASAEPRLIGPMAAGLALVALRQGRSSWSRVASVAAMAAAAAIPVLWRSGALHRSGSLGLEALPAAWVALAVVAVWMAAVGLSRPPARPLRASAVLLLLAMVVTAVDWRLRTSQIAVTPSLLKAAEDSRGPGPLVPICSEDPAARAWLPALVGRAVVPAWLPPSVGSSPLGAMTFCDENPRRR